MAANRALDYMSKRGVEECVKEHVVIPGVEEIPLQQLYRAMDFLLENEAELQKQVYYSVANLLNLEVDILYFDTTHPPTLRSRTKMAMASCVPPACIGDPSL